MIDIGYEVECLYCGTVEEILSGKLFNTRDLIYRCDCCSARLPLDRRGFKKGYKKYEKSNCVPLRF